MIESRGEFLGRALPCDGTSSGLYDSENLPGRSTLEKDESPTKTTLRPRLHYSACSPLPIPEERSPDLMRLVTEVIKQDAQDRAEFQYFLERMLSVTSKSPHPPPSWDPRRVESSLVSFDGLPWEDPKTTIEKWTYVLRTQDVPESCWVDIAARHLGPHVAPIWQAQCRPDATWKQFTTFILDRFGSPSHISKLRASFHGDRQPSTRPVELFLQEKLALFRRLYPEEDDASYIVQVIELINPAMRPFLRINPDRTADNFITLARQIEGDLQEARKLCEWRATPLCQEEARPFTQVNPDTAPVQSSHHIQEEYGISESSQPARLLHLECDSHRQPSIASRVSNERECPRLKDKLASKSSVGDPSSNLSPVPRKKMETNPGTKQAKGRRRKLKNMTANALSSEGATVKASQKNEPSPVKTRGPLSPDRSKKKGADKLNLPPRRSIVPQSPVADALPPVTGHAADRTQNQVEYSPMKKRGPLLLMLRNEEPPEEIIQQVKKEQDQDRNIREIKSWLKKEALPRTQRQRRAWARQSHHYTLREGVLYYVTGVLRPYVPQHLRAQALARFLERPPVGHANHEETRRAIRSNLYWPNMIKDIRKYLRCCLRRIDDGPSTGHAEDGVTRFQPWDPGEDHHRIGVSV